jgi:WD40 repeat protein
MHRMALFLAAFFCPDVSKEGRTPVGPVHVRVPGPSVLTGCSFRPKGAQAAVAGSDGVVRLFSTEHWKQLRETPPHSHGVRSISYDAEGRRLACAVGDGEIQILDADSLKVTQRFDSKDRSVISVSFSDDGRWLAASGSALNIWDLKKRTLAKTLDAGSNPSYQSAFSRDGLWLACATADGTVRIWSTDGWVEHRTIQAHQGWVAGVAFSADSKSIASGGSDHRAFVWNVETGEKTATFEGHGDQIRRVAFLPDGKHLVTGGGKLLRVWDVASRSIVSTVKLNSGGLQEFDLSPDGRSLAATWYHARLTIWGSPLKPRPEGHLGATFKAGARGFGWDVADVDAGSPAERAGLKKGDWFRFISGEDGDPERILADYRAGDTVEFSIERNRRVMFVSVKLGERR